MARCHELLYGAIDLHTHSAPSFFDRLLDDVGLAEQARAAGMRAVLYKAHEQDTTGRAVLVRRAVPGIEAFGGVVLNHAVGGLNPAAVDASIKLGGRMVWMPTMAAQHHIAFFGGSHFGTRMKGKPPAAGPPEGLTVLDGTGGLRPEVREILQLIAAAGICLSTGHLSLTEIQVADQKALADAGAILEKDVNTLGPPWHSTTLDAMVHSIREVGPARCVLATDYGQLHSPAPVEGMRIFVQLCLEQGISEAEIRTMVVDNPVRLLGLD